jgi:hypothetical protein
LVHIDYTLKSARKILTTMWQIWFSAIQRCMWSISQESTKCFK